MKRWIKILTAMCIVFAVVLPPVSALALTPAEQAELDSWKDAYFNAQRDILSLEGQINSLQQQLNNMSSQPSSTPRPTNPKVTLLSPQTITLAPGEQQTIDVSVKNIGTSTATGVLTQALPERDSPFTAEFTELPAGNIAENATRTMKLRISVDADAEPGTYAIDIKNSYKDRNADNIIDSDPLYVRITGQAQSPPNILLRDFKLSKSGIAPGDSFILSAGIENLGGSMAYYVQTVFERLDTDALYPSGNQSANYFSEMEGHYTGQVNYTFTAAPRAETGAYPVGIKVTYRDAAGKAYESAHTYYINIFSAAAGSRSVI